MSGCGCNCGAANEGSADVGEAPAVMPANAEDASGLRMVLASERGSVSRRGVLTGSAAAVAVLALGACSASEETVTSTPTSGDSTPTQAPTDAATPSTPGTPSGDPIAGVGDFPVGGGVVVRTDAGVVVITHPTDSEFLAFDGRCPHAGCPVTEVVENTIMCNCHGSTFDGSTGQRVGGPAPSGLEPVPVVVEGGEIFLT